jgi:hypothetical protein
MWHRVVENCVFCAQSSERDQNRTSPNCQEAVHQRHWQLKGQLCLGSYKTHQYFITYINLHSQYIINECIEFWWSGWRRDMKRPNLQVFTSLPNKTLLYLSYSTMQCCSQSDKPCALMSYKNGLFSISNSIKQFHKSIMWIYFEWHSLQISWQLRERDFNWFNCEVKHSEGGRYCRTVINRPHMTPYSPWQSVIHNKYLFSTTNFYLNSV